MIAAMVLRDRLIFSQNKYGKFMGSDSVTKRAQQADRQSKDRLLVSRREAAWRLSISLRALDYLIANGSIPRQKIGSRILIPTQALVKFASSTHPGHLAR
jgi:excisionase family DNA binding protein